MRVIRCYHVGVVAGVNVDEWISSCGCEVARRANPSDPVPRMQEPPAAEDIARPVGVRARGRGPMAHAAVRRGLREIAAVAVRTRWRCSRLWVVAPRGSGAAAEGATVTADRQSCRGVTRGIMYRRPVCLNVSMPSQKPSWR